jgi:Protein of unknown function, DUF488
VQHRLHRRLTAFHDLISVVAKLSDAARGLDRMPHPFYTIGHSTRPIDGFIEPLRQAGVQLVVDVRTVPRSRTNPQYNHDALPETLSGFQIGYVHMPALGGLRGKNRDVPSTMNAYWVNQSFHNYADYAMSREFGSGLAKLRELGHAKRCAIMCAEALWWRRSGRTALPAAQCQPSKPLRRQASSDVASASHVAVR